MYINLIKFKIDEHKQITLLAIFIYRSGIGKRFQVGAKHFKKNIEIQRELHINNISNYYFHTYYCTHYVLFLRKHTYIIK